MSPNKETVTPWILQILNTLAASTGSDSARIGGDEARDILARIDAIRAEERTRADVITPAMIQAAKVRVQGPDEEIYPSIYRAMRAAARSTDNQSKEGGNHE